MIWECNASIFEVKKAETDCRIKYTFKTWRLFASSLMFTFETPFKFLQPTGHVMHQQFNIQQLYALPTLYLCVLYLSENKERLVPLTAQTDWFL
jgi:hypothetical protein